MEGRYLKIFARGGKHADSEIHEKEFILLDSKNNEGKAVLVDHVDPSEEKEAGFERTRVSLKDLPENVSSTRIDVISGSRHRARSPIILDYVAKNNDDIADRYVRLDHTYNISFMKYKWRDLGMLSSESLTRLRLRYIEHLMEAWRLGSDVRRLLDGPPSRSSAASEGDASRLASPSPSVLNAEGTLTQKKGQASTPRSGRS